MDKLIRVQDNAGRGPWRAGVSAKWSDPNGPSAPPIFDERPDLLQIITGIRTEKATLHFGCAVRQSKLGLWFSHIDLNNLHALGYRFVNATPCRILVETPYQALIVSKKPLKKLSRIRL